MTAPDLVVKVGGSLLDWQGLPRSLDELIESLGARRAVFLVGGGSVADALRGLDRVHRLGEDASHRLALRALDLTAHTLAALVPAMTVVDRPAQLAGVWGSSRLPLLAPGPYFEELEMRASDPLPRTWETTTDSIAARVAWGLGAGELWLLKRTSPAGIADLTDAVRRGVVDPNFPQAARGLRRVLIRNLTAVGETVRLP